MCLSTSNRPSTWTISVPTTTNPPPTPRTGAGGPCSLRQPTGAAGANTSTSTPMQTSTKSCPGATTWSSRPRSCMKHQGPTRTRTRAARATMPSTAPTDGTSCGTCTTAITTTRATSTTCSTSLPAGGCAPGSTTSRAGRAGTTTTIGSTGCPPPAATTCSCP